MSWEPRPGLALRALFCLQLSLLGGGFLMAAAARSANAIAVQTIAPIEEAMAAFMRRDFAVARTLLLKLAEADDARAQFQLGRMYYFGTGVEQDYRSARLWFERAAEHGSPKAQKYLADMYLHGRGLPEDADAALRFYGQAAEQGDPDALMMQAFIGSDFSDPASSDRIIVRALRLAAERGDLRAKAILGWRQLMGLGLRRNAPQGLQLLRDAASQGNAEAQNRLGDYYSGLAGGGDDPAEAARWYSLAARNGNNEAQRRLGVLCAEGKGVPRDPAQAYRWLTRYLSRPTSNPHFAKIVQEQRVALREAMTAAQLQAIEAQWRAEAEQGDAQAAMIMAWISGNGEGVPEDRVEAVRWFGVAAEHGSVEAQSILGYTFAGGGSVEVDHVEAYKWLSLFISSFDSDAFVEERERAIDLRDEVAGKMDANQLDKARSLIEAWWQRR